MNVIHLKCLPVLLLAVVHFGADRMAGAQEVTPPKPRPYFDEPAWVLPISFLVASCLQGQARAEQPREFYREGLEHFEHERHVEATRAFRAAADAGDAAAIDFLGWMYLEGKGVPKSPWIAFGYFMDAAAKGNDQACRALGNMYFDGMGVEQDYAQAVSWWEEGARRGSYRAAHDLAQLLYTGDGVAVGKQKAIKLWATASQDAPADDRRPAIALAFAQIAAGEPEVAEAARKQLDDLARDGSRGAIDAAKYLAAREKRDVLLLDVPYIHQAHNYCAPASAATVLRYQGIDVSQFEVHRLCPNTRVGEGVYWSNIVIAASKYKRNWRIETHAPTEEGFTEAKAFVIEELTAGRPVIIDWFDTTNAHTVVLCGYDNDAKEFYFRDPGLSFPGLHVRSENWLKENWATRGYIPNADAMRRALIRLLPAQNTLQRSPAESLPSQETNEET